MRRWISLALAVGMIVPIAASVAEGAMATWLSPQQGQIVSGGKVEVAVGYNTGSSLKVSAVELYVDGRHYAKKILRTPETRGVCSFLWDTTRVEQGTHNLVVKVYSGDQVISKVYGTGTVGPNGSSGGLLDVRPPVVTFANIKAGDVIKGTKTIKMNAVDDSGQNPMVSLMVDENLKLLKNTPPYTYDLDSTNYSNGDHALKTFAYDAAGNRSDPAVIKVEFRNGDATPTVTTLTVIPDPEPAKITTATPPSLVAESTPLIKRSAARSVTHLAENYSAAPVVAVSEPKPIKIAAVPKPDPKVVSVPVTPEFSAPVLSNAPVKMVSAASSSDLRCAELEGSVQASVSADMPVVISTANASGVPNSSAAKLPAGRATLMSAPELAKCSQPAVPNVWPAPQPVLMASVKNLPAGYGVALKTFKLAEASPSSAAAAAPKVMTPTAEPKISKSALKQVRVAMAPDFGTAAKAVVSNPATTVLPAKARIEKKTVPAKGKVKVRSFFDDMGGVLFWDPSTRTVTACTNGLVIEMQIGSKVAKANGHEFTMDAAPYIVGGRTFFETRTYAQACNLLDSLQTVGKA